MVRRRLPRWPEFQPLLRPERIPLDPTERRLGRAHTIPDLRKIAARRVPRAVFDYTDGAAEREIGLRRARNAFTRVEFHPQALRDVSGPGDVSLSTMGTASIEEVAAAAPYAGKWFQLYVWRTVRPARTCWSGPARPATRPCC